MPASYKWRDRHELDPIHTGCVSDVLGRSLLGYCGKDTKVTPEACLRAAIRAINEEQWDKVAAYATVGLLSLAIGAAEGLLKASQDGVD